MVMDQSQLTAAPPSDPAKPGPVVLRQAVAGLTAPQTNEAVIREAWPTVIAANSGAAALGKKLIRSMILRRSAGCYCCRCIS